MIALLQLALSATSARADCRQVPPPVVDISLERFYEDGAGSVVEPTRMEAHKAQTAPLVEFTGFITKQADKAFRQRGAPDGTAKCALSWITAWAKGGAYLGKMNSKQAEAQRKWDLAGTALAYVKLKHWASAEDRTVIEPWLSKWADAARSAFDDASIKRNNHWYWLGLGEAAVAIATDDATRWRAAKSIYEDALKDITAEGTLPLEMARQGRALYYHVFALEPLVVMAEIAAARGEDWYALGGGALHRLVKKTAEGLADPAVFDTLAGVAQQRPVKSGYGWASPYRDRFFERMPNKIDQPIGHRWLGGDVDVLTTAMVRK
ncbi:MAG: alginate lyase family protein [Hyphomicrobium sp.]